MVMKLLFVIKNNFLECIMQKNQINETFITWTVWTRILHKTLFLGVLCNALTRVLHYCRTGKAFIFRIVVVSFTLNSLIKGESYESNTNYIHRNKTGRPPMKRVTTLLLMLALLSLCMIQGCKKSEKKQKKQSYKEQLENPHLIAVPRHAGFVARMNARNIAEKGNLKKVSEMKTLQRLFIEYSEGIQYKAIITLMKNPQNYGLNGANDIYVFAETEDSTKNFVGFTVAVSDSLRVVNFHEVLSPTTKPTEKEGFARGANDVGYWGWNGELFFYIANIGKGEVDLKKIFTKSISQKKGISQNANFQEFMKTESDISIWIASSYLYLPFMKYTSRFKTEKKELTEWLQLLFPEEEIDLEKLFQDNYIHSFSNFENGKAISLGKAFKNPQIERMIKKYDFWHPSGISKKTLEQFPADSLYFLWFFSIDMDKIRTLSNSLQEKYKNTDYTSNWFISIWNDKNGIKAAKAMGGDIAIALSGIQTYSFISFPTITVSVSMKDLNYFPTYAQERVDSGDYIDKRDYYTYQTSLGSLAFHLKQIGSTLVITTKEEHITNGFGKNITQNQWGEAMLNQSGGLFINANYDEYPDEYKKMKSMKKRDSVYIREAIFDKWLLTNKNSEWGNAKVTFKNREVNGLSQIITYADTAAYIGELADSLEQELLEE